MTNQILRKRIITCIAMSYAMNPEELWVIYEKVGSYDILLQAIENGTLKELLNRIEE
jgi:glutaredoxin-related protein